jgi:glycosyltransferase involved in cell wall biosynthesis
MNTLTVIIPTYNEEAYLFDALYSVQFADEIIVIDSFSTDKTVEIAKAFNCKILKREFDNFSSQKNHALNFATSKWVLFLDADERITQNLRIEILNAVKTEEHFAYKLSFQHFFMNRFLYHHNSWVTRLALRKSSSFAGDVHEKLNFEGPGKIGQLSNPVIHYTYRGLNEYIRKRDKYIWFQAKAILPKNIKVNYFHLLLKPVFRFFKEYIFKRGFLDGIPGLAVAAINAYGVFSRYAKLILLQKGLK